LPHAREPINPAWAVIVFGVQAFVVGLLQRFDEA
jgi:hypothetical protein